jgi:hypothetical protein
MTRQELRDGLKGSAALIGLFILGSIVDTLDGWPLTIAGWLAAAVAITGYIAYKRSTK